MPSELFFDLLSLQEVLISETSSFLAVGDFCPAAPGAATPNETATRRRMMSLFMVTALDRAT